MKIKLTDKLMPIREAVAIMPGPTPSSVTLSRWHHLGLRGHRLPVLRIKGKLFTTAAAVAWFVETTTAAAEKKVKTGV